MFVYIYFWVLMVLQKLSFAVLAAQRQKDKEIKGRRQKIEFNIVTSGKFSTMTGIKLR